jgi:CDP-4-dehydro-6-deoxyglucose reductase
MIIPQKATAKLADKEELNSRFTWYRFELVNPLILPNEAGQYISIEIAPGEMRMYSMCDRPDVESSFEIIVDQQPGGTGVDFLRQLSFGQQVQVLGPLGKLTINAESDATTIVLVATGSGIAPFKSIVTDQLQIKNAPQTLVLLWGMRHDQELFWLEDFMAIQNSYPQFTFIPVISQPSTGWTLTTGHVTDFIQSTDFIPQTDFYLCGNRDMVDEVQKILADKKFSSERIHSEKF